MESKRLDLSLRLVGLAIGFGGFIWMIGYCLSWQNDIIDNEFGLGIHFVLEFYAIPFLTGILISGLRPLFGGIILVLEGLLGIVFILTKVPTIWHKIVQNMVFQQTIIFIIFSLIMGAIFLIAYFLQKKRKVDSFRV